MSLGNFVDFNEFYTPSILRVVYLIGAIVITLGSLILILFDGPFSSYYHIGIFQSVRGFITILGLFLLIVGNIFWRVLCEFIVVQFKIFQTLDSIDTTLINASRKER